MLVPSGKGILFKINVKSIFLLPLHDDFIRCFEGDEAEVHFFYQE